MLAASLTLLPALLSFSGARVGATRARRSSRPRTRSAFWARWVGAIQRRPVVAAVAATALMLALAAPALGLRLGTSDAGNDPAGHTTRQAYDLLAQGFGKGFNGPLLLTVRLPATGQTQALTRLTSAVEHTPGRGGRRTRPAQPDSRRRCDHRLPHSSPESEPTTALVNRLRDRVIPPIAKQTRATVDIGGSTATGVDFSHVLSSSSRSSSASSSHCRRSCCWSSSARC